MTAIAVTGDVTLDWNLARREPEGARACLQRGGAALLADLVAAAGGVEVLGPDLPAGTVAPGDERFSHSYATWAPFGGVWRVESPMGLDPARSDAWVKAEWERLGRRLDRAGVVVLDDAGLGYRRHSDEALWQQAAAAGRRQWVLLKMAKPVAEGRLWEHLSGAWADRLVVLMTIDDLRGTDVQVSREHSWECTAQDLLWELVHNPAVNALSLCAHVVVSFGAAGAFVLSGSRSGNGAAGASCSLLFDTEAIEGMWEAGRPGGMIGATTCLAASLARRLALEPEAPDLGAAVQAGVAGMRILYDHGYGEASADPAFPLAAVAAEIAAERTPLERAEVPAARPGRRWTILEDRYKGGLIELAERVAVEGPEAALRGVPLGRFGKLLTVDRGEIESLRSVRALIAEYCRAPQVRPLSLGVFGAPGSGKSFGIVQVAGSVAPGAIGDKMEFNLSQFASVEDIHDALHQVRDVALSGAIPLVFWDEFDSQLEGRPLGWLRYFLAPMQDGAFREGQLVHPIGRAIFVFAGGTSERMEEFGQSLDEEDFRNVKGPDFVSRLKGYVNVLGPNPRRGETDPFHVIRRAVLLRSILSRSAPQVFDGNRLEIDPGVLRAFLEIGAYRHGARSLETIVAMSLLSGEDSYQRSSLPPEAQLDLHVNGVEFLALVQRMQLEGELLERLAEAMHAIYCEDLRDGGDGGPALVPWAELADQLKEQNRAAVRDIPAKLARIGHVMLPARSHEAPFDFPGAELDSLAMDEHDRYVRAKQAEGWRAGAERDDDHRIHPSLVPWDELPDEEREKDRRQVRSIPRVLARAGYTVVPASLGAGQW